MAKKEAKEESQDNFDWEMATDDVTFFGDEPEEESEKDTSEKEEEKEESEEEKEESEEEEETTFFEEEESEEESEEEEEETKNSKKPKDKKVKIKPTDLVNTLKEAGALDFELEEGTEMTEDLAKEILEDDLEDRATEMANSLIRDLPADIKALTQYALKGGTLEQFLAERDKGGLTGLKPNMDLNEEDNQIKVVKQRLEKEGRDSEYVEAQIEFLKDKGLLESTAKADYSKWEKIKEQTNKELVENQRKAKERTKEVVRQHKASVNKIVSENKEIFDLPLSRKDKSEMGAYIAEKSVTTEQGAQMTPFHRDLYAAMSNPEKAIALAKILRDDFSFKGLKSSVVTKEVGNIKKNVKRTGSKTSSSASRKSSQNKSLADLLTE